MRGPGAIARQSLPAAVHPGFEGMRRGLRRRPPEQAAVLLREVTEMEEAEARCGAGHCRRFVAGMAEAAPDLVEPYPENEPLRSDTETHVKCLVERTNGNAKTRTQV